jgi:hypothetical protein
VFGNGVYESKRLKFFCFRKKLKKTKKKTKKTKKKKNDKSSGSRFRGVPEDICVQEGSQNWTQGFRAGGFGSAEPFSFSFN